MYAESQDIGRKTAGTTTARATTKTKAKVKARRREKTKVKARAKTKARRVEARPSTRSTTRGGKKEEPGKKEEKLGEKELGRRTTRNRSQQTSSHWELALRSTGDRLSLADPIPVILRWVSEASS